MSKLTLYTFWRSSAAYRVRIALNLKGLSYTSKFVDLSKDGGENWKPDFRQINAQGLVPVLEDDEHKISQSASIIEYLDECYPEPPLLPQSPQERAYIRSLAQLIACEIHPLNSLRVLDYLNTLNVDDEHRNQWYKHWISEGFKALEIQLVNHRKGLYCFGDTPGLADIFLIPQVYSAHRYHCDITQYPIIEQINHQCFMLDAFKNAAPDHQEDAVL